MSIKLELDADSIKLAITTHISNQGFNLAGKIVEVALVNGRGGNGNRATITISDDIGAPAIVQVTKKAIESGIEDVMGTVVDVKKLMEETLEEQVKEEFEAAIPALKQDAEAKAKDIVDAVEVDLAIMASAESSIDTSDPDDVLSDFFPAVKPESVETPKSLF